LGRISMILIGHGIKNFIILSYQILFMKLLPKSIRIWQSTFEKYVKFFKMITGFDNKRLKRKSDEDYK
jgi:hypothetical protein